MPCPECTHCRAAAALAHLTLPPAPVHAGSRNVNQPFYMAFGAAYTLARQSHRQPMAALRRANPWLTPSQCGTYLKRARQLGYVQPAASWAVETPAMQEEGPAAAPRRSTGGRPPRRGRGRGRTAAAAPAPSGDLLDLVDDVAWDNWTRRGQAVTADVVAAATGLTVPQALVKMTAAADAGWVSWDTRVPGAIQVVAD